MERPHAQSSARKLISDESLWTSTIPAPLALYQYLEELPMTCAPAEYEDHLSRFPHITSVPLPPTLPRILDKVILNSESRRSWDEPPTSSPGLDDNSILPVPNHVVLNHLTASAIKNGTLGVGTTTRYRKKVSRRFAMAPPLEEGERWCLWQWPYAVKEKQSCSGGMAPDRWSAWKECKGAAQVTEDPGSQVLAVLIPAFERVCGCSASALLTLVHHNHVLQADPRRPDGRSAASCAGRARILAAASRHDGRSR